MRILIYTDPHVCATSSIVRTRGEKYTTRLENEIKSIDWAEKLAMDTKCDAVFCLGDFFDKSELSAEELTALGDIKWANVQHYFIVGNHEMGSSNLSNSSAHILNLKADIEVIDRETRFDIESKLGLISLQLIPYVLESDRKPFVEYVKTANPEGKKYDKIIVFSHNDLKGIRYGTLESRQGFDVTEIEKCCDLFINGHLHNGSYINNNPNMMNNPLINMLMGNMNGNNNVNPLMNMFQNMNGGNNMNPLMSLFQNMNMNQNTNENMMNNMNQNMMNQNMTNEGMNNMNTQNFKRHRRHHH